jgi:hypothetical protein
VKLACSNDKVFAACKHLVLSNARQINRSTAALLLLFLSTLSLRTTASDLFLPDLSPNRIAEKQHLSIIFADRNIDAPESMFGHLLLLAHDHFPPEPSAIVIEFAAVMDNPGFSYPAALFSHVEGKYLLNYYFIKQRSYDLENRNLVVMKIEKLTQSKIRLGELIGRKSAQTLPYTFLQFNCAYYIGKLLEEGTDIPVNFQKVNRPFNLAHQLLKYTEKVSVIYSSQQNFYLYRDKLSTQYDFDLATINQLRFASAENEAFTNATSAYIQYQLPRMPNETRRQELADLKKEVWHQPLVMDSQEVLKKKESTVNIFFSAQTIEVGYRTLAMSFDDEHGNEALSGNHLLVGGLVLSARNQQATIKEVILWRVEAIRDAIPSSRYIDISHLNYSDLQQSNETFARIGVGIGINDTDYSIAATPFAGIRFAQSTLLSEWNAELGARVSAEKIWTSNFATQMTAVTRTVPSSFVSRSLRVTNKFIFNQHTNLLYRFEQNEVGESTHSIGMSVNF